MEYQITDNCKACNTCVTICPNEAVKKSFPFYSIDQDKCQHCGTCYENCRHNAIVENE